MTQIVLFLLLGKFTHMCEGEEMGRGCVNLKFKDQEEESYNVDIYKKLHCYCICASIFMEDDLQYPNILQKRKCKYWPTPTKPT